MRYELTEHGAAIISSTARVGPQAPRRHSETGSCQQWPAQLPRACGRDLRALTGVVPSLVFPARRAADRTVKGRLCPPSGEMTTIGCGRAERVYRGAGRQQRHCRGLAGGTLNELYALAETNGREPCAASSEWPASQRKCSIRAILLPSTNAVPQAAPSSAQNRQAKEGGEKGHSCEPT
jgi:hypothetical protein